MAMQASFRQRPGYRLDGNENRTVSYPFTDELSNLQAYFQNVWIGSSETSVLFCSSDISCLRIVQKTRPQAHSFLKSSLWAAGGQVGLVRSISNTTRDGSYDSAYNPAGLIIWLADLRT